MPYYFHRRKYGHTAYSGSDSGSHVALFRNRFLGDQHPYQYQNPVFHQDAHVARPDVIAAYRSKHMYRPDVDDDYRRPNSREKRYMLHE